MRTLGSKRRTSAEVQRLVLSAATEAFAQEGFGGAATRRIAESAGVNETVIFRYFLSKAGLYDAAVLRPARIAIGACAPEATDGDGQCACRRVEGWVRHIDAAIAQHHTVLVALFNPGPRPGAGSDLEGRLRSVREDFFRELDRGARAAVGGVHPDFGRSIAVRAILTMLMARQSNDPSLLGARTHGPARASQHLEIVTRTSSALLAAALPAGAPCRDRHLAG